MLTIILTSRVAGNRDSNIKLLLDSLVFCGGNRQNCEVIVKYDDDDDEIPDATFFGSYPFNIKQFIWSRGEGRHGFHLDHFYLFAQRNLESTFVLLCADDFTFTRPGFIEDIISIKKDYCFVGPNRPRVELYAGNWHKHECMEIWKHNEGVSLPCFSTRCIEVLQNYGWQCNADNWQTLLTILLHEQFSVDIWKIIPAFFTRNKSDGMSGYSKTYNNMEIDGSRNAKNEYYYRLVYQQAKNVYLNILFDEHVKKMKTDH